MNEPEVLKILLNAAKDIAIKYQNFEVAHQIRSVVDLVILQESPPVSLLDAFEDLRKASGSGWDLIDNPTKYLKGEE